MQHGGLGKYCGIGLWCSIVAGGNRRKLPCFNAWQGNRKQRNVMSVLLAFACASRYGLRDVRKVRLIPLIFPILPEGGSSRVFANYLQQQLGTRLESPVSVTPSHDMYCRIRSANLLVSTFTYYNKHLELVRV